HCRFCLSLASDQRHVAFQDERRCQEEPAYAWPCDGFLHPRRSACETAQHWYAFSGRWCRLLSAFRFAFRPYGRRQCPLLATHEPTRIACPLPEWEDGSHSRRW